MEAATAVTGEFCSQPHVELRRKWSLLRIFFWVGGRLPRSAEQYAAAQRTTVVPHVYQDVLHRILTRGELGRAGGSRRLRTLCVVLLFFIYFSQFFYTHSHCHRSGAVVTRLRTPTHVGEVSGYVLEVLCDGEEQWITGERSAAVTLSTAAGKTPTEFLFFGC